MILVNSQWCLLRQFNRQEDNNIYDDQNYSEVRVKCVPYAVEQGIAFDKYSVPQATGYYMFNRNVDLKEGDQIKLLGKFKERQNEEWHTIQRVEDGWVFSRQEMLIAIVK